MHHSKKITLIIFSVFLLSFNAFSIGAGVQFSGIPSVDIQKDDVSINNFQAKLTGTFRLFRIPSAFGLGIEAGSDFNQFVFGPSAFFDYYFIDTQIENNWSFYAGAGTSGKLMFTTKFDPSLTGGLRLVAGFDWVFFDNYLEYYSQIVAEPSYVYYPSSDKGLFRIALPIETGVRLHF